MQTLHKLMLLIASVVVGAVCLTAMPSNLWHLATAQGFVIPAESSALHFRVLAFNDGSGEWWEYGEDRHFYYHFTGYGQPPYKKMAKSHAQGCVGFDKLDASTWCAERP